VDGVKDGKYAFHTALEPRPWWQVDLGSSQPIARVVVYNRLDYAPGLHNADHLLLLTSDDGREWNRRHENPGRHFGGVSGAPPLEIRFAPNEVRARFVRLQIPSEQPIYFHLDEVEIYGPAEPGRNIALHRPADQSSLSQWSTAKIHGTEQAAAYPTAEWIARGRRLAAEFARCPRPDGAAGRAAAGRSAAGQSAVEPTDPLRSDIQEVLQDLDQLETRFRQLRDDAPPELHRDLYLDTRRAVRRLVFLHPALDFDQLLFVKRFTQETYPDVCLNHMPWVSRPGGDICIATLAGPTAPPRERHLLGGALGPGHVHGLDLWWDADRVVFGYARAAGDRPPEGWLDRRTNFDLRRNEEPIHLFEINIDGSGLRQLTSGEWSDLDPTYLPGGDIAFVSERCGCSLQCNEFDKDETSCNLFVMRSDGSDIRQLSVSKDGDYLPHCLDDGTIGYTRWEYQERSWAHIQSIWFVRPDGTGADALFKQHLNDPWALEDVRSLPGTASPRLAAIATGHHTLAAGPVVVITPGDGMNDPRSIRIVTPGVRPPEGGMSGTPVDGGGVCDSGGFYMTPWPLTDSTFLVSYSYSDKQTEPAGYGIYLIDLFGTKELLYRDPGISSFVPIPLQPRTRPPILPESPRTALSDATCLVSDVNYGVAEVTPIPARYLRIAHRLQWPYDNQYGGQRYHEVPHTRGIVPNWTPVRILGEVPIEEDGSAYFRVPADTPVYFQLLDENHMELRRMRSFISFQPGEQRSCVGCHETRAEAPGSRTFPLALTREPSVPVPPPWGDRPLSFLRDIQPIFDEHCVGCHGGLHPAAGLDFSPGLTERGAVPAFAANRAYDTIRTHELVARSNVHDDARVTAPLAFGSHKSKLVEVLRSGACSQRAKLTEDDWLRLVTWIDANAPYHDGFINKRSGEAVSNLPADRELLDQLTAVHSRRCSRCHEPAEVTRPWWIDIRQPEQSLFLRAPLAQAAGGGGKCAEAVYPTTDDPDYREVRRLVEAAVARAWKHPRRDLKALVGHGS
jgi:mono/diheme cytochrome c family protein